MSTIVHVRQVGSQSNVHMDHAKSSFGLLNFPVGYFLKLGIILAQTSLRCWNYFAQLKPSCNLLKKNAKKFCIFRNIFCQNYFVQKILIQNYLSDFFCPAIALLAKILFFILIQIYFYIQYLLLMDINGIGQKA